MTGETSFSVAYSLAMIMAFVLLAGGLNLWLRRNDRKRGLLMIAVAAVLVINVLIWTIPLPGH